MANARSLYVMTNGRIVTQPASEDFPYTPMALTYAVTVLDGRSYARIMRQCQELSLAEFRPSLLR